MHEDALCLYHVMEKEIQVLPAGKIYACMENLQAKGINARCFTSP
jgi:hypothetical protein